jgi:hypothetical protein
MNGQGSKKRMAHGAGIDRALGETYELKEQAAKG